MAQQYPRPVLPGEGRWRRSPPPKGTVAFRCPAQVGDGHHLLLHVDYARGLVYVYRKRDDRYYAIPAEQLVPPELAELLAGVRMLAKAEGLLPTDIAKRLLASVRTRAQPSSDAD